MFETSGDLLNLVLAISIGVFTIFLCWLLYVLTQSLRRILSILDRVKSVIDSVQEKIDRASKIFDSVEEKLKSFTSLLPLVISGINKIIDVVKSRQEKKRSKKTEG